MEFFILFEDKCICLNQLERCAFINIPIPELIILEWEDIVNSIFTSYRKV